MAEQPEIAAPIARVGPPTRPKHPLRPDDLAAFRDTMPGLRRPSAELLRDIRDDGL